MAAAAGGRRQRQVAAPVPACKPAPPIMLAPTREPPGPCRSLRGHQLRKPCALFLRLFKLPARLTRHHDGEAQVSLKAAVPAVTGGGEGWLRLQQLGGLPVVGENSHPARNSQLACVFWAGKLLRALRITSSPAALMARFAAGRW